MSPGARKSPGSARVMFRSSVPRGAGSRVSGGYESTVISEVCCPRAELARDFSRTQVMARDCGDCPAISDAEAAGLQIRRRLRGGRPESEARTPRCKVYGLRALKAT